MLLRSLLLLFTVAIVHYETRKIDRILKNVSRRWGLEMTHEQRKGMRLYGKVRTWLRVSDEQEKQVKGETAQRLATSFVEMSSSENPNYDSSVRWIESLLDPNMTAEICGVDRKMNYYIYSKYMTKTAFQYKRVPEDHKMTYTVMDTAKSILQVRLEFEQIDKFNLRGNMIFEVTMNATFIHEKRGSIFSIIHVSQGGACHEHGTVSFSDELGTLIDDIEDLKNHPNFENLFRMLTPRAFKNSETNRGAIPEAWLMSLDPVDPRIEICHEGVTEPVRYTVDQFLTWYDRFSVMWHPEYGNENYTNVQILKLAEQDEIVARFTMNLQIGVHENMTESHEWNFKIQVKYNARGDEKWYITHLEVLCAPSVFLKDQSFVHIRAVVTDGFLKTIEDMPPPVPWWSTVDFVRKFTKKGHVEIEFCDTNNRTNLTQLEVILFHQDILRKANLVMYFVDYDDIPLPATELTFFKMQTLSSPDNEKVYEHLYEHLWTFTLKWDMMDQFFYVDKLKLDCAKLFYQDRSLRRLTNYIRISGR